MSVSEVFYDDNFHLALHFNSIFCDLGQISGPQAYQKGKSASCTLSAGFYLIQFSFCTAAAYINKITH